jgi:hypothetical protein
MIIGTNQQAEEPATMEQVLRTIPFKQPQPTDNPESIERLLTVLVDIAGSLRLLIEIHTPTPKEIVGTSYVADILDYTPTYVAEMARDGIIPACCTVPGTGNGKPWKFYREQIDKWIESR